MDAPAPVEPAQLIELGIRVVAKSKDGVVKEEVKVAEKK
jgi:hypothetical protein